MRPNKLDVLMITVPSPDQAAQWLRERLFFKDVSAEEDCRLVENGNCRILLCAGESSPLPDLEGGIPSGFMHIALSSYEIEEARAYCYLKKIPTAYRCESACGSRLCAGNGSFCVAAPFGVLFEFCPVDQPDGPVGNGLCHLSVAVSDMQTSVQFYQSLGFTLTAGPAPAAILQLGDFKIRLYPTAKSAGYQPALRGFTLFSGETSTGLIAPDGETVLLRPFPYDVVAAGECLIDFNSDLAKRDGNLHFTGNPGGAPANVLAAVSRLDLKTAFIGKVGDDVFGHFLCKTLERSGIDISAMRISDREPTTLAFVSLDETGNRSFRFYRNQTADCALTPEEIDNRMLRSTQVFHFGSVSMTAEPSRSATLAAVKAAKAEGALISYDPNLRELLWSSLAEAKTVILDGMQYADLIKISDNELTFLTGIEDMEAGAAALFRRFSLKLLVVTLGPDGCICVSQNGILRAPSYAVDTIDTNGAGDAFWGAFLYRLITSPNPPEALSEREIASIADFANAAGSLATTKNGAIPSLPCLAEIRSCMATVPRNP